jgi:erythromycin esterase-like protein
MVDRQPETASEDVRLTRLIAEAAEPLPDPADPAFGRLFDRFAGAQVVLLGEASHGTSEFYRARAAITRRLIEQHGFTIVAAEADWPDASALDRYARGKPPRHGAEPPFRRFPVWMWRNTDVQDFIQWMRGYNARLQDPNDRAGFFGLDIYNMNASISAVITYLQEVDPKAAETARERYSCMDRWRSDPALYGRDALRKGFPPCEDAVVDMLQDLLKRRLQYASEDWEDFLDAERNARLIASAERYYRIMYYGPAESWNLRDTHMFETLEHLVEASRRGGKAVVWAHNSHIGNALATEMGVVREELNLGQLCRERWGRRACLIGFGTHTGTVAAATDWDGGRWRSSRSARRGPAASSGSVMTRANRGSCSTFGPAGTSRCGASWRSRAWSASSASSTGPRPS